MDKLLEGTRGADEPRFRERGRSGTAGSYIDVVHAAMGAGSGKVVSDPCLRGRA